MKKYLTILLACAAVFACQNKEDLTPAQEEQKKFTTDEAYLVVSIADAGSLTSKASLGGFEDADNTADGFKEGVVKSAHFYFYDKDGIYVSEASAWRGGNVDATANDHIEFNGKNVVVLKGLEKKNYPKFMVTVLNKTNDFKPGSNLQEMEKALSRAANAIVTNTQESNCLWNYVDDTDGKHNYFTMSTSSYVDNDPASKRVGLTPSGTVAEGEVPYFATLLKETDFLVETSNEPDPDAVTNPVVVYVERLAAKVTLTQSLTTGKPVTIESTNESKTMYELKVTLAGDDNNLSGTSGFENVYIDLLGWTLNATAKNSYMSKNVDPTWTDASLGFTWNVPGQHRSYWGKSFNYDVDSYKYHKTTGTDATPYVSTDPSFPLHYQTFESTNFVPVGKSLYCAENTNTVAILNDKNGVTNIMLKAKVYKETAAGNLTVKPLDMVRYNGVLYQTERFYDHILSALNTMGNLKLYYVSGQAGTEVTHSKLNAQFLELVAVGTGVKAQLKADYATDTDITWPVTTEKGKLYKEDPANSGKYVEVTGTELTSMTNALNSALETASSSGNASAFKGGEMYYTIRIQHANPIETTGLEEANYGVVRNHAYKVNVSQIKKIGYGIFDEKVTTDVGGTGGGDEPESYYVGAQINVLSWKIVNQDVEL